MNNVIKRMLLTGYLTACAVIVLADRYVVEPGTPGGTNAGEYTNWSIAATQIQWAVNKAVAGETVWVTNGTYVSTGAVANASMVNIEKGITLRSMNGAAATFLDGNYPAVTSRCFYINHTSAVVNGFTASNGNTSGSASGGGVTIAGGKMQNCVIINNVSASYGGGVYLGGAGTLLQDCSIVSNRANSYGGGIFTQGAAIISNCFVEWNYTPARGGGIHCNFAGLLVQACRIKGNSTDRGGGISLGAAGAYVGCIISNNTANCGGGAYSDEKPSLFSNCVFAGNTGTNTIYSGGGMYLSASSVTSISCKIVGNVGAGAAGGVYCSGSNNFFYDCLIALNSSVDYGSGVRMNTGGGNFWNCTVVSNTASLANRPGLYAVAGNFMNTIVCSNSPLDVSGAGTNTWFYNCLLPSTNGLQGSNNIAGDPAFVDFTAENYRLTRESPGVNTGLNAEWMTGAFDLDGRDRLDKYSRIVDIGCYEFVPAGTMCTVK